MTSSLVKLGLVEHLDAAMDGGDLAQRDEVAGVVLEHDTELLECFMRELQVLRRFEIGHHLRAVGGGEIETRRSVGRIKVDRGLEVVDGVFVLTRLERLHAFDELVAGLELGAARHVYANITSVAAATEMRAINFMRRPSPSLCRLEPRNFGGTAPDSCISKS